MSRTKTDKLSMLRKKLFTAIGHNQKQELAINEQIKINQKIYDLTACVHRLESKLIDAKVKLRLAEDKLGDMLTPDSMINIRDIENEIKLLLSLQEKQT